MRRHLALRVMCNISGGWSGYSVLALKRCSSCPHLWRSFTISEGKEDETSITSSDKSKYRPCSYNTASAYLEA